MRRLKDAVVGDRLRKIYNADLFGPVLTGDSNLDELKDAIDKVKKYVENYDPKTVTEGELVFKTIYATSVVSHGVDLDELNFMVFQGLPYATSEYVQALSRVGRKQLGVVFLWFYPNRVRDDSFYRNFNRYHNSLDHEVKPVPINRFARLGLHQTINSLFCAGIMNYLSDKKGRPLFHKKDVMDMTEEDEKNLVAFIESVYGGEYLDIDVAHEVSIRLNQIKESSDGLNEFFPNILKRSGDFFFRNQSGMRGIQKQLALGLKPQDIGRLKERGEDMPGKDIHSIPESSSFFQGHIGQFFSKSGFSFRIQSNYSDQNKLEEINTNKYKPRFLKIINRKIAARNSGGGNLYQVTPEDLIVSAVKLIDDVDREDVCGIFEMYPRSGLCTKDGCNSYFEIDRGRTCGHRDDDPWEQFTFLAFCVECGRLLPLHYMTNIFNDCKKCGGKNTLTILRWGRNKDDMSSYRVKCTVCGSEERLYFYPCDHTDRNTRECISTRPKKRFRGVPARAGAIIHPHVISIPDIPQEDEIDQSGRKNSQGRMLSEAFSYFFSYEIDGALLNLPEFQKIMSDDISFWQLLRVNTLCEDKNLDLSDRENWSRNQLLKIIKSAIKIAKERIEPDGSNHDAIIANYGIDKIKRALTAVKDIDFDENDLQGIYLLDSNTLNSRDIPKQPPDNYSNWLGHFGLKEVVQISDLTIVQALIGIIEGSTRKEGSLFRPIETGRNDRRKATVFVRDPDRGCSLSSGL
ncbi:MAG: hypothetical protein AEth_00981 [Candidatus Argoarchaeum ethanivorans]|uniref:Helicase C-terminal domain-containing protein n=1 Tax=Candidatus Argoarchaeum ethanivorans TaxID=2608793 RepID=A0A8B3S211_9EURY|nr:MAG: hypothetical protein AEth_00981 [Candidatus Argoarchaeum ethanivorans]